MSSFPEARIVPFLLLIVTGLLAPPAWPLCGDGILDAGETCDDGNFVQGDGCRPCLVEPGWSCTAPGPADTNALADGSLEQGPGATNPDWSESATGTVLLPICEFTSCGVAASLDRTWFAWFNAGTPNTHGRSARAT